MWLASVPTPTGQSARELDVLLHSFPVDSVLQMKPEGLGFLSDNRH